MLSESKKIKLSDGVELHAEVSEVGAKKWIVCVHGIGEHLGRHKYIKKIVGQKFNVLQFDLRGHGKSQGVRGNIDKFETYLNDTVEVINYLIKEYRMESYVFFGHSMGALIAAGVIQDKIENTLYPELIYLSAPPVEVAGILGEVVSKIPRGLISKLVDLPSIPIGGLMDLNGLSHDPKVIEDYINDPLCILKLHTHLLVELVNSSKKIFSKPLHPKVKSFVSVGSEDGVVSYKYLKKYFKDVEKDFVLKEFMGARHEVHNEIDKYKLPYLDYLRDCLLSVYM